MIEKEELSIDEDGRCVDVVVVSVVSEAASPSLRRMILMRCPCKGPRGLLVGARLLLVRDRQRRATTNRNNDTNTTSSRQQQRRRQLLLLVVVVVARRQQLEAAVSERGGGDDGAAASGRKIDMRRLLLSLLLTMKRSSIHLLPSAPNLLRLLPAVVHHRHPVGCRYSYRRM